MYSYYRLIKPNWPLEGNYRHSKSNNTLEILLGSNWIFVKPTEIERWITGVGAEQVDETAVLIEVLRQGEPAPGSGMVGK